VAPALAPRRPAVAGSGPVALRYRSGAPIVVTGPVTGRRYRFSVTESVQLVARVDAERLLSTGLFENG
jgi:hypothetical protein